MKKILLSALISAILLSFGGCKKDSPQATGQTSPKTEEVSRGILEYVPQQSLFCLAAHDLENISMRIDDFALGLSPIPFSAATSLKMVMVKIGGEEFEGIDVNGDFLLMGIPTGETIQQADGTEISKPTLVLGIPVKDFSQIESLEAVSGPDSEGYYSYDDNQGMQLVFNKVDDHIFVTSPVFFPFYVKALNAVINSDGSFAEDKPKYVSNDAGEKQIWLYGDFKKLENEYGVLLDKWLTMASQAFTGQFPGVQAEPPMPEAYQKLMPALLDFYRNIFKQVDALSFTLEVQKDRIDISKAVAAVEGTTLASVMIPDDKELNVERMAYIGNDNFMTMAFKQNSEFYKEAVSVLLKSFGETLMPEDKADALKKYQEISLEFIDAMESDSVVGCYIDNESENGKFGFSCVAGIKDVQAFNTAFDKAIEFWNSGVMSDILDPFGLSIDLSAVSNVGKIESYDVGKISYQFDIPMSSEEQQQTVEQMFGNEWDYYWTQYDNLFLAVTDNEDFTNLKTMIDKIENNAEMPLSLKNSYDMLGDYSKYEVVGSYNYVRLFSFYMKAAAGMFAAEASQAGKMDFKTESDIVFGMDVKENGMIGRLVLPKKHIQEMIAVFSAMQQQFAPQQPQQQQQQPIPMTMPQAPQQPQQ
jgi:hypothetical protein